jgi:hypothetical protein
MAKSVFTNGYLLLNGVDLSAYVRQMSVDLPTDSVDATTMGATNKQNLPGLGDFGLSVTFAQDFGASLVDQTLAPLVTGRQTFGVEVRATNAARSTTNPAYTCTVFCDSYSPIGGSVGDLLGATATFKPAGNYARQTS